MHMRTTLIIDDELLAKAQELSGLREKTAVLHAGLQALISRENARRLAALGGTERGLKPIARRRTRISRSPYVCRHVGLGRSSARTQRDVSGAAGTSAGLDACLCYRRAGVRDPRATKQGAQCSHCTTPRAGSES